MRFIYEITARIVVVVLGLAFVLVAVFSPNRAVNAMKYALSKQDYWVD